MVIYLYYPIFEVVDLLAVGIHVVNPAELHHAGLIRSRSKAVENPTVFTQIL